MLCSCLLPTDMGLIKANTAPTVRASAFSMADIEKQARAIVLRARQGAGQVRAEAQREGEQLRGPESMTLAQFNRTIPGKEKGFALRTR